MKISNGVNKKISFPIAIIIIVILAVLVGGLAFWQYFWVPKIEISEFKPAEKNQLGTETANWKIYKNEEYGFEIKYPSDWEATDQRPNGVVFAEEGEMGMNPDVEVSKEYRSVEEVKKEFLHPAIKILSEQNIIIDNKISIELVIQDQLEGEYKVILIPKEDKLTYNLLSFKDSYKTFNQMLSTFRFLE